MTEGNSLVSDILRFDKSSFDAATGLRSAFFVITPLIIGFVAGQRQSVFSGLGALWLSNTEGPRSKIPIWVLLVACLSEAAAAGLGTLVGISGLIAPVFVGVGIFVGMLARLSPKWSQVGMFTAITFAVGVGLPGDTASSAVERTVFSLIGALWALAGIALHRYVARRNSKQNVVAPVAQNKVAHKLQVIRNSSLLGVASAVGFGIGLALGLPRDFWIVVTIILTIQPTLNNTIEFTAMMVLGTIAGAVIGGIEVLGVHGLYYQLPFLALFAFLMFSLRGVNFGLVQVFLTPFLIVLLNILYHGQVSFVEARVIDVAIGGAVALVTVYILRLRGLVQLYFHQIK